MFPVMLASRTFDKADQVSFACLSGDFNPIHMDPLTARRTNASSTVVHGIHAVLWALDKLVELGSLTGRVASLNVQFIKFVFVGDRVELRLLKSDHISIRAELALDDLVAATLVLGIGSRRKMREDMIDVGLDRIATKQPADILRLEELEKRSGWIDGFASPEQIEQQFRYAAAEIGAERLTAIALLSPLVGMVCPGLHSLFAAFSVELLDDSETRHGIGFRVKETDERFRMVRINVFGSGVSGSVQAFLRWPPVTQASVDEIARLVAPIEFAGSTALIIGGSRGLGSLTAKIIAAGGGNVIITYATGQDDALKLAQEINTRFANNACKTIQYDAREEPSSQLEGLDAAVSHLYYFATPQIARQKKRLFVSGLLDEFVQVYVKAFYDCCHFLSEHGSRSLTAYYPSSVFVETHPTGMAEYSMAKMAGEILCSYINRAHGRIHVIMDRLPRLLTDQTATLPPVKSADPLEIMLPIIRKVQSAQASPKTARSGSTIVIS
jgi:hypothetical protein